MAGSPKYKASKLAWDNLEKMDIIKCLGPEDTPYWTKFGSVTKKLLSFYTKSVERK